jgi:GMP synthase (glutamine-hydrolysing)
MILIIYINNEKFHYLEFVKPIEDILKKIGYEYKSIHYKNQDENQITKAEKIIIPGTSLRDNKFFEDIELFNWIRDFNKPILGICGGMHLLGLIFGGKLKKIQEIGLIDIRFKKEFLGKYGIIEVYELHNFYVEYDKFDVYGVSEKCLQAIKHNQKPFYGVLFHPEVRNKDLILNFINL